MCVPTTSVMFQISFVVFKTSETRTAELLDRSGSVASTPRRLHYAKEGGHRISGKATSFHVACVAYTSFHLYSLRFKARYVFHYLHFPVI